MIHAKPLAAINRRRVLTAAAAAGASLFALAACASSASAHRSPGGLASIEVFDRDSGQVVPTYRKDGRQYVVITSSGGSFLASPVNGDEVTAYALPAAAQ